MPCINRLWLVDGLWARTVKPRSEVEKLQLEKGSGYINYTRYHQGNLLLLAK